jgi:hypothetical protein
MNLPIQTLKVTRFRSLRDLKVGPFGNVNLITGKNNAGKSSLLEAIRILSTEGSPSTFHSILSYREESTENGGAPLSPSSRNSLSPRDTSTVSSLFSDFPNLAECSDPFVISNEDDFQNITKKIGVKVGWYSELYDAELGQRFVRTEEDLFGDSPGVPFLEIEGPRRNRRIRLDNPRYLSRTFSDIDGTALPCVYLDPFSSRSTSQLAMMWDSIALTAAEEQIVSALKIISPDITDVSMIGSSSSRNRMAIAKSKNYPSPVPLRSFGDGVNRLFGIILSLTCAKGGLLLVDEIENGLHHSSLVKIWEIIFQMSRALNVQIFATSHSWDCIDAFQDAANNDSAEGTLIRLTSKGDKIIPTMLKEDELRIAARDQIELR